MRILYLDTSSSFLYCGLVDDNSIIFEIKEYFEKDLSKDALYEISKQFIKHNIKTNSIDKIIVVNGPGSFTGIRIGVDIAKTYGWCLNIPIIPISSLEAMAISTTTNADLIVPIIDARRGYVFGAIYSNNGEIILNDQYIEILKLKREIEKKNKKYVFVSNSKFDFSVEKYDPDILKIINRCKNYECVSAHRVNPKYLKLTEAEEKMKEKQ